MAFNWKRTKNLTLGCLLVSTILLSLILNNRHIEVSDVHIKSKIKGHLASHKLKASLSSKSWLPKVSFLVIHGNHSLTNTISQIKLNSSGGWNTGFILSKSLIHHDEKTKELLIPYLITPGHSFNFSIYYEEITQQSLHLPQLYLEEGGTDHRQLYTIDIDNRFKDIFISSERLQLQSSGEFIRFQLERETQRQLNGPKLRWKYTQILNPIQFMG